MNDPERGFLLHLFHRQQNGRPVLFGVGRLESGSTFAFADSRRLPCFYLRESELARARPFCLGVGAELDPDTALATMDGEAVVRVDLRQPRQLRRLAEGLQAQKLRTYEADVAFTRQWLVALGVRGPLRIGGSWRPGNGVDRVYVDPEVTPGDWEPDLRLLALDIETTPDAGRLLACSLAAWGGGGEAVEEIHLAGEPAPGDPAPVRCHATEADLLTALEALKGARLFSRRGIEPWDGIWLLPADPAYDMVGGGITILESRTRDATGKTKIVFTSGHIAFRQSLLVRAADAGRLAGYNDLTSGVRVGVLAGTTGEARLLRLTRPPMRGRARSSACSPIYAMGRGAGTRTVA